MRASLLRERSAFTRYDASDGSVAQLAEAKDLKSFQYGFESRLTQFELDARYNPSSRRRNVTDTPDPSQQSVEDRARSVVESVRPYIQADGGDIDFVGYDDGVVTVRLRGACTGCPHAAITLKAGVERHLREHIPEVKEVVNVP